MIKVPRPDGKPDYLGLKVLDEPAARQSDRRGPRRGMHASLPYLVCCVVALLLAAPAIKVLHPLIEVRSVLSR